MAYKDRPPPCDLEEVRGPAKPIKLKFSSFALLQCFEIFRVALHHDFRYLLKHGLYGLEAGHFCPRAYRHGSRILRAQPVGRLGSDRESILR